MSERTEEELELETLEVETRVVDEIGEVEPMSAGWVAAREVGHAQKVREHLTSLGR